MKDFKYNELVICDDCGHLVHKSFTEETMVTHRYPTIVKPEIYIPDERNEIVSVVPSIIDFIDKQEARHTCIRCNIERIQGRTLWQKIKRYFNA
jgi:hypothetical protein